MNEPQDSHISPPSSDQRDPAQTGKQAGERRGRGRRLLIIMILVLALLASALLALYALRREAARQILIGWLERRGIEADLQIERLELNGLTARIRVGDPADPDFSVERVEVDYALGMPWSPAGLGVSPSRVRLIRPILRASWRDGVFSMGSLDPLVEEFRGRPPGPEARGPLVLVENGRLNLATEYGPLDVRADARIEDGRLMRLEAAAGQAALASGETTISLNAADLALVTQGDRTRITFSADIPAASAPGVSGEALRIAASADAPYPDLNERRSDGDLTLSVNASADRLDAGHTAGRGLEGRIIFSGQIEGWLETFQLSGDGQAGLTAASFQNGQARGAGVRVALSEADLQVARTANGTRWRLDAPLALTADALRTGDLSLSGLNLQSDGVSAGGRTGGGRSTTFEAGGAVSTSVRRMALGDLNLTDVRGRLNADLVSDGAVRIEAAGNLEAGRGAWPLLGAAGPDDAAEMAALKTALGAFRLQIPSVQVRAGGDGTQVTMGQGARITPLNGGLLTVSPHPAAPLYAARPGDRGGGAFILSAQAPETDVRASIPEWRLTPNGFMARLDAQAGFNFAIARGVQARTAGVLNSGGGRMTYQPDGCVDVAAEQLVFGENDARALSGVLCPSGGPLLTVMDGGWAARGRIQQAGAAVPFLDARLDAIDGPLSIVGTAAGLSMEVGVERALVQDTAEPRRFHVLTASGSAGLQNDVWQGRFDLASGPHPLGWVDLKHDGRAEAGGVTFDSSDLTFSEQGLQPSHVTPLTEGFLDEPVDGRAGFTGRFNWSAEGVDSEGRVVIDRLNFQSPAGAVTGLAGEVAFTSLTPLITAPDQRLTAEGLAAMTPLTDLELMFELGAESFRVSGADLDVAGGRVVVEPFDLPLDRTQPFAGTLVLETVQLGELLDGAGLGERVDLDAVVSGRLPFTWDLERGFRVVDGSLYAVQPGRLEIAREALSGLEAGGGGEDVPPNVVQDLAYQAMEELAFDILTAQVNSLDEGRLGVLFRIRGRHDPPQHQELRLTVMELIRRDFLNRELPLPSGTEIDLTLDTSVNLNQLVADFLDLQRARRGEHSENSGE